LLMSSLLCDADDISRLLGELVLEANFSVCKMVCYP
jgi:hypothetical protein